MTPSSNGSMDGYPMRACTDRNLGYTKKKKIGKGKETVGGGEEGGSRLLTLRDQNTKLTAP